MNKTQILRAGKNFRQRGPFIIILCIIGLILFKPLLVGEAPLFCFDEKYEQGENFQCTQTIKRLIPHDPKQYLSDERLMPPLSKGQNGIHWMGTDHLGRDIAAIWINALSYSFLLSILAGLIALTLGMFLGGWAGYFGKKMPTAFQWEHLVFLLIITGLLWFFWLLSDNMVSWPSGTIKVLVVLVLLLIGALLWRSLDLKILKKRLRVRYINIDRLIMSIIELFEAIPGLLILLSLLSLIEISNLLSVSLLLGSLGWMTIARYVRAEAQQIRTKKYLQDYKTFGFNKLVVMGKHFLPGIIAPVSVVMAYSIAAFVIAESTLSFLGIGLPEHHSSWGSLLNDARRFPKAWWMGLFPGLGILMLVVLYYKIAEALRFSIRREDTNPYNE